MERLDKLFDVNHGRRPGRDRIEKYQSMRGVT
jgi:hypothetical protein